MYDNFVTTKSKQYFVCLLQFFDQTCSKCLEITAKYCYFNSLAVFNVLLNV